MTINNSFGAISGALDPDSKDAIEHADSYYESIRKMKNDYQRIASNTGYSEDQVLAIKNYLFVDRHHLTEGHTRFSTDFRIAQSWQRMIDGKNIRDSDHVLLKHELLEMEYVAQGMTQDEAHRLATKEYNYYEATEKERG